MIAVATLLAGLIALVAVPAAQTASPRCNGLKATIKPKGKSGQTHKMKGTNGDDVIVSEGGKQKIDGRGGNDTICAGKGADRITGGDGDDAIFGGGGADRIDGGTGNDSIHGERGSDAIADTGGGDDMIFGEDGSDDLDGGPGNDTVSGYDGTDKVNGGDGNDTLTGERGSDTMDGGPGDDNVNAGIDNDRNVTGGDGTDAVSAGPGDDEGVSGGPGDHDMVNGDFGNDEVDGGPGDSDVVNGGNGGDEMNGGPGVHDIASYATATPGAGGGNHGVTVDLAAGFAAGESEDTLAGFEDVLGSAFEDTLTGASPSSRIDGFLGQDKCLNGLLNQLISCNETAPTPVCVTTCVDLDSKRIDGVAHLVVLGTSGSVAGTSGSNAITVDFSGGAFVVNDTATGIRGLTGCTQGAAAAAPVGPATCKTPPMPIDALIWGGNGNDSLSLSGSVPTSVAFKLNGGEGNDDVRGGPGNDVVDGGATGLDALYGGDGTDVLQSRQDADQMHGGPGDDLLETNSPCDGHLFDGGDGTDNASFAASYGAFDVTAEIGGIAIDKTKPGCLPSTINSSNEYLEGGPGDDTLIGDGSNNSLLGRAGKDTLIGGGGNDLLNGLEGADTYIGGPGKEEIRAQDGQADAKIDCGPPAKAAELALVDKQDPKTVGCDVKKKKKKKH